MWNYINKHKHFKNKIIPLEEGIPKSIQSEKSILLEKVPISLQNRKHKIKDQYKNIVKKYILDLIYFIFFI